MSDQYVVVETPPERVRCFCTITRGNVELSAWTNRDYWWYQISGRGPGKSRWSGVALLKNIDHTKLDECWLCVREDNSGTVLSVQGGRDMHAALVVLAELVDRRGSGETIEGIWPRPLQVSVAEVD